LAPSINKLPIFWGITTWKCQILLLNLSSVVFIDFDIQVFVGGNQKHPINEILHYLARRIGEEIELERQLFEYIGKEYPINVQILNIMKQLRRIVQNNDQLQDDEFMDMSDCIINAVDKYTKRVNYYRNYANLISKHESEQQFNNAFGKR
jgi:hypothetical protein